MNVDLKGKLRASLLQEAVAGRLVPQDPADEPASKLLKRIAPKATPLRGDIPYDIPGNWEWCRLGSVCDVARGGSPRPIEKYLTDAENGVNWIKIGDTKPDDKYVRSVKQKIKPEGVSKSRFVHKGDFLLTNSMSFGRPYILNVDGCIHDGWLVISPMSGVYDKDFLYYLLSSAFAYSQFSRKASGGVVNNLNSEKVSNSVFPLPPLAEQKRIVAKIEELMPLVDEYEKAQEEFNNLNAGLKGKLRASLLQEAISGRLVPQDPSDEPASKLLKRINPKAIPLETEQPLPQGWCACKMGELIDIVSGVSYEKGDVTSDGIRILRGGNIQDGKILTYPDDVFLGTKYRNSTSSVRKGDIVMVASTGSFIALGKTGYCLEGMENTQIGAFLRIIRAKEKSLSPLLNLFFSSDAFKALIRRSSKGTSINNIKNGYITEIVFPLPPLAEQKRIVEKLESLFAVLDSLDKIVA